MLAAHAGRCSTSDANGRLVTSSRHATTSVSGRPVDQTGEPVLSSSRAWSSLTANPPLLRHLWCSLCRQLMLAVRRVRSESSARRSSPRRAIPRAGCIGPRSRLIHAFACCRLAAVSDSGWRVFSSGRRCKIDASVALGQTYGTYGSTREVGCYLRDLVEVSPLSFQERPYRLRWRDRLVDAEVAPSEVFGA
jgi:hypothetical protein